ncbi:hypothetical protein NN561_004713 [Cricetulus griseus]
MQLTPHWLGPGTARSFVVMELGTPSPPQPPQHPFPTELAGRAPPPLRAQTPGAELGPDSRAPPLGSRRPPGDGPLRPVGMRVHPPPSWGSGAPSAPHRRRNRARPRQQVPSSPDAADSHGPWPLLMLRWRRQDAVGSRAALKACGRGCFTTSVGGAKAEQGKGRSARPSHATSVTSESSAVV